MTLQRYDGFSVSASNKTNNMIFLILYINILCAHTAAIKWLKLVGLLYFCDILLHFGCKVTYLHPFITAFVGVFCKFVIKCRKNLVYVLFSDFSDRFSAVSAPQTVILFYFVIFCPVAECLFSCSARFSLTHILYKYVII